MKQIALVLVVAALAGCNSVSISNPFTMMRPNYDALPQEAMREAATKIETAVAAGDRDAKIEAPEGISLEDDVLSQAIRTRVARNELVQEFLDRGHAYEKRNGLVAVLRSAEYKKAGTGRSRDRDAVLVIGENRDRWALYEGIVKTSNLSPDALGAVQAIFHEVRVSMLKAGNKYEDESGQMLTK